MGYLSSYLTVLLSRLLRKKPIECQQSGPPNNIGLSKSQILMSAARQMANAPLIIGYLQPYEQDVTFRRHVRSSYLHNSILHQGLSISILKFQTFKVVVQNLTVEL